MAKIIKVNIDGIKETPNNPRQITKKDFDALKKSLVDDPEFLEAREIVVDENMVILGGNQRLKALKALGKTEIEVKQVTGWSDEKKRRFVIKDNIQNGDWDFDILANHWDDLPLDEWMDVTGVYNEDDIVEDEVTAEDVPDDGDIVSKTGEIYQLGEHRVACGDSLDEELVEKLFDKKIANVIFSSPPYNMGKGKMYDKYEDNRGAQEYIDFNLNILNNWGKHHKGFLFWNTNNNNNNNGYYLDLLCDIKNKTKYKMLEMIHWDKSNAIPVGGKLLKRQAENIMLMDDDRHEIETVYYGDDGNGQTNGIRNKISNYWGITHEGGSIDVKLNTATYPVKLPARGISFTTKQGDIVADPFLGTGTTLIACEQMGRICYGCEMDEKQVDVIRKRYWKFKTGSEEGWEDGTRAI